MAEQDQDAVKQGPVKDTVYEKTSSRWKTGLGFFLPIVRINEVKRKATVAAAEHQDAVVNALDGTVDKLAAVVGVQNNGFGKATTSSRESARDAVYDNTENVWKTGAAVLFPFAAFLRVNEVSRKSAVAAAERQQEQLGIVDAKLNQIAWAVGVDVSDLSMQPPGSARNAVYDATTSELKSGGVLAGTYMTDVAIHAAHAAHVAARVAGPVLAPVAVAAGGAAMLRTNEVSRHSVGASAEFQDMQISIMEEKTRRIAGALGINPEEISVAGSGDSRSADEKVMDATKGTGASALGIIFGSVGGMFRINQVSRKAVSAATEHQEERLARLSSSVEAVIRNAPSQQGVKTVTEAEPKYAEVAEKLGVHTHEVSQMGGSNPEFAASLAAKMDELAAKQQPELAGAGKGQARK